MTTDEVRERFIKFFEKHGHKRINPSPLVLENDPTTLFTSSGMQQLVPYLLEEPHPKGKRLVDSQPCFRTVDIEEVGNTCHLTFFEMLGNWSLGDYFKEEQLTWFWEFLTKELKLPKEKLYVSVFEGTKDVPKDDESVKIWKKLGVPEEKIFYYGVKENWWSRSGTPDKMPPGEIGGPDSEVFYEFIQIKHNPKFGKKCHPNCDCGRFLEIGNSVFIQYKKKEDGFLEELPQKNVDFGGGLARISAAVNNEPDIFQIDLFKPVIEKIEEGSDKSYKGNEKPMRIIADHLRAATFMASEGVMPSNKEHGYVLRRLIRKAVDQSLRVGFKKDLNFLVMEFVDIYGELYSKLEKNKKFIKEAVENEDSKYSQIRKRLRDISIVLEEKIRVKDKVKVKTTRKKTLTARARIVKKISGKEAFRLYSTHGFSPEQLRAQYYEFDEKEFQKEKQKHQELSRKASAGMFKGGLADSSKEVTEFHTTTHLIHAALREVLGEHVQQKGSNITVERLRFDFSHPKKLTDEEIKKVEDLVNQQIEKDLPVSFETKTYKEAIDEGALAFFGEKYSEKVKVYTIGSSTGSEPPFSREVCGGPHITHTGELGRVKIFKQNKIGSGLMRLYAKVESN